MLRECIELCPLELWVAGGPQRPFWRIAYHALFYTHLYMMQTTEDFIPWINAREHARSLWEHPDVGPPYTPDELLAYLDEIDEFVPIRLEVLDLDAAETGFSWYPNMGKLEHQLVNLRHLQGHVGQLSELLMQRKIETTWRA